MTCELKLVFNSEDERKEWVAWYIGQGEYVANFYTNLNKSQFEGSDQFLILDGPSESCPNCKGSDCCHSKDWYARFGVLGYEDLPPRPPEGFVVCVKCNRFYRMP